MSSSARIASRSYSIALICCLICVSFATAAIAPDNATHKLPAAIADTELLIGKAKVDSRTWSISGSLADRWTVYRYESTSTIARGFGKPMVFVGNVADEAEITRTAIRFGESNAKDFGLDGNDFTVQSIKRAMRLTIVSLQPEIDGVPIYDAQITLALNQAGGLASIKARGFGSEVQGDFRINESQAIRLAEETIQPNCKETNAIRIYYPVSDGADRIVLRPAFEVTLQTVDMSLQPVMIVDGETGEILAAENRVYYDQMTGTVEGFYYPLYGSEDQVQAPFQLGRIQVDNGNTILTDEEGAFEFEVDPDDAPFDISTRLQGQWVTVVRSPDWVTDELEIEVEEIEGVEIVWNDDNSFDDDRSLYYHVNVIHDYWKNIDTDFGLDISITTGSNLNMSNAYSNAQGIFFGNGGGDAVSNFANYADVVYHEYAHSVTGMVYRGFNLPYQGESGAMNEGWSDYFACSLTDEPLIGEGGLMGPGRAMRNIDNNLRYPDDIVNQVHSDGRIISAAMWHTREQLGAAYCDSLFHFARYLHARDFESYFIDVLLTDDDDGNLANGTPNYDVIIEQFSRHGITLAAVPYFGVSDITLMDGEENGGNDNGLWESGELVTMSMNVFRRAADIPMEDTDVMVRISSEHEAFEFEEPVINLGVIGLGEGVFSDQELSFRIADNTVPDYASILIEVFDGEIEEPVLDSIMITVGLPSVLLYRDGFVEEDYTKWYDESLDELELVYTEYTPAMQHLPLAEQINLFDAVIWFTGDDVQEILSEATRDAFMGYMSQGGRVILSGQRADEITGTEVFFGQFFGARNTIENIEEGLVRHVRGDQLLLIGSGGARNQTRSTGMEALESAEAVYYWPNVEGEPTAGVRYHNEETGARSYYLGFGLESVVDRRGYVPRSAVIREMLQWFDVLDAPADDMAQLPGEFILDQPYPNPFNGTFVVPFRLNRAGRMSLTVFDLAGREVFSRSDVLPQGSSSLSVDASGWGTGVYLVNVSSGGVESTAKVLLMK